MSEKLSVKLSTENLERFTESFESPKNKVSDAEYSRLWKKLISGASGTFGLKIAYTAFSFLYTFLLARILEISEYGTYVYARNWIELLLVLSVFGCSALLIREVSACSVRSSWGLMNGLILWTNRKIILLSILLSIITAAISLTIAGFHSRVVITLCIGTLLLPLVSLLRLKEAVIRGLHRVVESQLPEKVIRPLLFILLIVFSYMIFKKKFTAYWAMGLNVFAAGSALMIASAQLKKYLPDEVKKASPDFKTRFWLRSALPLILIDGVFIINNRADILILGALKGTYPTAIYAIAARIIESVAFIFLAVNTAVAPTISRLYTIGDNQKLQKIITKSARLVFILSFPFLICYILFSYWLLLIFGTKYTQGQNVLIILGIGQLINIARGPVALTLVMTGHERITAIGVGFGAVLNILLNFILIPKWGMEGAAVATTCSMILWITILVVWIYNKIGIHSTVLGRIRFLERR